MKHKLAVFFVILASFGKMGFANSDEVRRLVLVTSTASGISSLSASETQRLFLGFPVVKNGLSLEAAINRSDSFLYEVFLQKIVFMSASVYERHLLTNSIQLGGQRPQTYNDIRSLIDALKQYPGTVTLMWQSDARAAHNLVILGEIWHGTEE